jgi:hypothetical protein
MSIPLTIYKTKTPDFLPHPEKPEDFQDVEFRQLVLRGDPESGNRDACVLELNQGWWYFAEKRAIHPRTLLSANYDTWDEAKAAYDVQLDSLAKQGYLHGFSLDPYSAAGGIYTDLSTKVDVKRDGLVGIRFIDVDDDSTESSPIRPRRGEEPPQVGQEIRVAERPQHLVKVVRVSPKLEPSVDGVDYVVHYRKLTNYG